jgi:septal ring factor EnvC (AmiA/AmiB activator)
VIDRLSDSKTKVVDDYESLADVRSILDDELLNSKNYPKSDSTIFSGKTEDEIQTMIKESLIRHIQGEIEEMQKHQETISDRSQYPKKLKDLESEVGNIEQQLKTVQSTEGTNRAGYVSKYATLRFLTSQEAQTREKILFLTL